MSNSKEYISAGEWVDLGNLRCAVLEREVFFLDGGAMFGIIPRILWSRKIAADAQNRIRMACRVLVAETNGRVMIVDTGIGCKLSEKEIRIYGITPAEPWDKAIGSLGLELSDVTDVVLTHLHFDHAGGAVEMAPDGSLRCAFPRATYHVSKRHWEYVQAPPLRDRNNFPGENYLPLMDAGRLNLVGAGNTTLFPGAVLMESDGHTKGQLHLLVNGTEGSVFFAADLVPTSAHLSLAWHMAYDNEPVRLLAEKKVLLDRAVAESWIVVFPHDPFVSSARIETDSKGYKAVE